MKDTATHEASGQGVLSSDVVHSNVRCVEMVRVGYYSISKQDERNVCLVLLDAADSSETCAGFNFACCLFD